MSILLGVIFKKEKDLRTLCILPMFNAYVGINDFVVCLVFIVWDLNGGSIVRAVFALKVRASSEIYSTTIFCMRVSFRNLVLMLPC